PSNQITQGARHQEILLHETQSLPMTCGIVGIQHPCQRFRLERLGHGAYKLAMTECLEIKEFRRGRRPQPQRVDRFSSVTDHGPIKRDPDQAAWFAWNGVQGSRAGFERAIQLDLDLILRAPDFPWILNA